MKNAKPIIILVLLAAIAGVLYIMNQGSDSDLENREFSVDASKVDKIFLVNETQQQVTLTKVDGEWLVNNKYKARKDALKNLLETLTQVQWRNTVPKKQEEAVFKNLISKHVKVEIYSEGKPIKFYFVGGASQDGKGTFMLQQDPNTGENHPKPYVTYIPGFEGYLTPRFICEEHLWRDRVVFQYDKDELKEIEVNYPQAPKNGFKIQYSGNNEFHFFDYQGKEVQGFDTLRIKQYMLNYKSISYEAMATQKAQGIADSLHNATPYYTIKCTDKNGNVDEIIAHRRKPMKLEYDINGDPLKYDTDRLFAFINGQENLFVIQYFVFDKLTVPYLWFFEKES